MRTVLRKKDYEEISNLLADADGQLNKIADVLEGRRKLQLTLSGTQQ